MPPREAVHAVTSTWAIPRHDQSRNVEVRTRPRRQWPWPAAPTGYRYPREPAPSADPLACRSLPGNKVLNRYAPMGLRTAYRSESVLPGGGDRESGRVASAGSSSGMAASAYLNMGGA